MLSFFKRFKKIILISFFRQTLTQTDIKNFCRRLEYPDLINLLVKSERVEYFSQVCVGYLNSPCYIKDTGLLMLSQILDSYIIENDKESKDKELVDLVNKIIDGAISVKRLHIGNIINRDSVYRKMIKSNVSEITSVDVSFIIQLLVKLNSLDLLRNNKKC